ncbi:VOC family protein [Streptomyces sp. NPDC127084]|uniref:VOC family protein n=1 Tax=Streptomyces sp. NPDC127084 TaxID=3347133 RepID=UPI0036636096
MAGFMEGMPCWVDAQLPDLAAGKRFYGELFGWTYSRYGSDDEAERYGHYTEAYLGGRRVAALVPKRDGRMPTTWGLYFATDDAIRTAAAIQQAGGQVIMAPMPVGPFGVGALAADPGGAVFGVWQQGERHTGFEIQSVPGAYCWTEDYTREKEAVDSFYTEVFGFQGTPLPDDAIDYLLWSPAGAEPGEDTAIGARSVITEAFPAEMPGHFLVYFAVADCDRTVEVATSLGGRITAPPFDIPYGRMAVLSDNQGASFAVLAQAGREKGGQGREERRGESREEPREPSREEAGEPSRDESRDESREESREEAAGSDRE